MIEFFKCTWWAITDSRIPMEDRAKMAAASGMVFGVVVAAAMIVCFGILGMGR